ncbi:MAG: hypothetical protein U0795_15565 [Pirellulales bacterium]
MAVSPEVLLRQALDRIGNCLDLAKQPIDFRLAESPDVTLQGIQKGDGSWELTSRASGSSEAALMVQGPQELIIAFLENREEGMLAAKQGRIRFDVNPDRATDSFYVFRGSFRGIVQGFSTTATEDRFGGISESFQLAPIVGFEGRGNYSIGFLGDPKFYDPNSPNAREFFIGQVHLHYWHTVSTALIAAYYNRIPLTFSVTRTFISLGGPLTFESLLVWGVSSD